MLAPFARTHPPMRQTCLALFSGDELLSCSEELSTKMGVKEGSERI